VEDLEKRGIALVVLSMGGQRIDTGVPTGMLRLTMLGAIATFSLRARRLPMAGRPL
jgi:DNA invertase Pin-like site-specific DNA recombinase